MSKKRRILFLDMMRVLALFMMIQGHTIYAFVNTELAEGGSSFFMWWRYFRGFTAPFFLFITGVVFMFLLLSNHKDNAVNPRVRTALKRVLTLFAWGYFLNFNFDILFYGFKDGYINQLIRVDVLHVIGTGLCLLLLAYRIYKFKKFLLIPILVAGFVAGLAIYWNIKEVDLTHDLPRFFVPYINNIGVDTMFPLVPWLSYIFGGAILGAWLSRVQERENYQKTLWIYLLIIGGVVFAVSELGDYLEVRNFGKSYFWEKSPNLVLYRMSMVILIGGIMAFFSQFFNQLPKILRRMSQNTLWLYIGHLIIIYSIAKPIIYEYYGNHVRFGLGTTLVFVLLMFGLMVLQTKIIVWKNSNGGWLELFKQYRTFFNKRES